LKEHAHLGQRGRCCGLAAVAWRGFTPCCSPMLQGPCKVAGYRSPPRALSPLVGAGRSLGVASAVRNFQPRVSTPSRGLRAPHRTSNRSPERVMTPQTLGKDSMRHMLPHRVSESSVLRCSSPLPYISNPARHILEFTSPSPSPPPTREETGGMQNLKHPRTSYQTSKPRPAPMTDYMGTAEESSSRTVVSPRSISRKLLPVCKPPPKLTLNSVEKDHAKAVKKPVRSMEMGAKTTADMQAEMMLIFNDAKVCRASFLLLSCSFAFLRLCLSLSSPAVCYTLV